MTRVSSFPSSYNQNKHFFIICSKKNPVHIKFSADAFVADDDTLVISGGLYDGHPIYDNVPTVSEDQSQFRLEFLH